jgi:selenocysteine-specific elongation factor
LTEAFLAESPEFAVPIESVHQFLNLGEEETRKRIEKMQGLRAFNAEGEKIYTTETKWQDVKTRLVEVLKDFHTAHPLLPGMEMEESRSKLRYDLSPKIFRVIIDLLLLENTVAKEGNLLRLPTHKIRLGGAEQSLMDKIKKILGEQPMAPPDLKEMERHLGVSRNRLNEVIRLLERDGSVARVATDLYFLSSCVDKVRSVLYTFLSEKGEITAAAFRDLLGSSRKYTIALLEYFDREGTTIRVGDIRRLKSNTLAGAGKQDASAK